jgi:diadenosine tetraphosphate (Ap4A) HIT family hydrolase
VDPRSPTEECPLCMAVDNRPLCIHGINANTILGRNERFVIIPALGPLVVGHVLAVSVAHTAGLRYLPPLVQENYESLSDQVRGYCGQLGDTVLEAEHGARGTSMRGPCIRHTHVHILPGLSKAAKLFENKHNLKRLNGETSGSVDSYLWISDGRCARTYDGSEVVGQQIRQAIGQHLNFDDWDWAVNPKAGLIASTIAYWSNIRKWLH